MDERAGDVPGWEVDFWPTPNEPDPIAAVLYVRADEPVDLLMVARRLFRDENECIHGITTRPVGTDVQEVGVIMEVLLKDVKQASRIAQLVEELLGGTPG